MNAFVVDNASLDQDGLFPVKLFVWFPGLYELCGVRPAGMISKEVMV